MDTLTPSWPNQKLRPCTYIALTDIGPAHVLGVRLNKPGIRKDDVVVTESSMRPMRAVIHSRYDGMVTLESLDPRPRAGPCEIKKGDVIYIVGFRWTEGEPGPLDDIDDGAED